jgi:hypothetical protein
MSNWIKIDEDLYCLPADPDPREVIKLSELEARVAWLNENIKTATPEELQLAWDAYNGNSAFKQELEKLTILINELKAL